MFSKYISKRIKQTRREAERERERRGQERIEVIVHHEYLIGFNALE